jgi:hypothetical protein
MLRVSPFLAGEMVGLTRGAGPFSLPVRRSSWRSAFDQQLDAAPAGALANSEPFEELVRVDAVSEMF